MLPHYFEQALLLLENDDENGNQFIIMKVDNTENAINNLRSRRIFTLITV